MFLIASLITSVIGGILLFVTDFGGWWEGGSSNYYVHIEAQFAGPAPFFIGLTAAAMLVTAAFCVWGLTPTSKVTEQHLKLLLLVNLGVVALTALLAIILATWWGTFASEWWFDAGFYGGVIGSLLTSLFLKLTLDNRLV